MKWLTLVTSFALCLALAAPVAAQIPPCLKPFTADMQQLTWEERRQVLRAVQGYTQAEREGAELILQYRAAAGDEEMERFAQTLRNFRYEQSVPNPFSSDRELMAAIRNVDQSNPGVENFGGVLSHLGQDNHLGLAQSGAFDVYIADDATRTGEGVAGFQSEFSAGGVSRTYDMKTLTGKFVENKSLVRPYDIAAGELTNPPLSADGNFFAYQDDRLDSLANETARSIILHAGDNYTLFQTNFRNLPQMVAQRADIEQIMLKQFDSGIVRQFFGTGPAADAARNAARDVFQQSLPTILRFK